MKKKSAYAASNELGMSTPIVIGQQTSLNSASFFLILLYHLGLFLLFS